MKNQSTSDAGSAAKATEKQKIQILKKAVLDLREQKSQLELQNKSLNDQLDQTIKDKIANENNLKSQIFELQEKDQKAFRQIEELQQKLKAQAPKQNAFSLFMGRSEPSPIKEIVQDDSLKEYYLNQIKQLQTEMDVQRANSQVQVNTMTVAYQDAQLECQAKIEQIAKQTSIIEELNRVNKQLSLNLEDLHKDYQQKFNNQQIQVTELQQLVTKHKTNDELNDESIRSLEKKLNEQIQKCMSLQSEIEETRGKYIQYRLIMKGVMDVECQLILRQNIFNEYIIEIETVNQRFIYKPIDVKDLKAKDQNSFMLNFKNRTEIFETQMDVKKTCKTIKRFLEKAVQQPNNTITQSQSLISSIKGMLGR